SVPGVEKVISIGSVEQDSTLKEQWLKAPVIDPKSQQQSGDLVAGDEIVIHLKDDGFPIFFGDAEQHANDKAHELLYALLDQMDFYNDPTWNLVEMRYESSGFTGNTDVWIRLVLVKPQVKLGPGGAENLPVSGSYFFEPITITAILVASILTAGVVIGASIILEPDATRKLILSAGVAGSAVIHGDVDDELLEAAAAKIQPGKTGQLINLVGLGLLGFFLLKYTGKG
ncbi:MAG: hypothetical protein ACPG77_02795, partial [Nannocystaceae bacterium]